MIAYTALGVGGEGNLYCGILERMRIAKTPPEGPVVVRIMILQIYFFLLQKSCLMRKPL